MLTHGGFKMTHNILFRFHFGAIFLFWFHFWFHFGSISQFWFHFGSILVPFWFHSGSILVPFWFHSGSILVPFGFRSGSIDKGPKGPQLGGSGGKARLCGSLRAKSDSHSVWMQASPHSANDEEQKTAQTVTQVYFLVEDWRTVRKFSSNRLLSVTVLVTAWLA